MHKSRQVQKRLPKKAVDLADYNEDPREMDITLHYEPKNYKLSYDYSPDNIEDIVNFAKLTDDYFQKRKDDDKPPNVLGLCNHLGVYRDTFYSYLNGTYKKGNQQGLKHYQSICKAAHQAMGSDYIEGGLTKKYNSQVAIMILSSKHGYGKTDTLNVNLNVTKDTSTMSTPELEAELASLRLKRASIEVEYTELEAPTDE